MLEMDHSVSPSKPKYKYASQIQFDKMDHLAEVMRRGHAIWNEKSRYCRYRAGGRRSMVVDSAFNQQICERTPGKFLICGWQHCTVDKHTVDREC